MQAVAFVSLWLRHARPTSILYVRRRLKVRSSGETCLIKLRPDGMDRVDLIHMGQGLLP